MTVKVTFYDMVKYDVKCEKAVEVVCEIADFKVVCGVDAKKIESETDANSIDDFHEYLVLDLGNGVICTLRNSYVDLFII